MLYFLAFLFSFVSSLDDTCNYLYHNGTDHAWATEVCIFSIPGLWVKYSCAADKSTIYVTEYSDEQCKQNYSTLDVIAEVNGIGVTFNCNGFDACYINFLDNCNTQNISQSIYSPIDTCIERADGKTSFKFTCDLDEFYYTEYTNNNCDNSNSSQVHSSDSINECDETNIGDNKHWQFYSCNSVSPTMSPSSVSPTIYENPSISPTKSPTIEIPFDIFNRSLDDIARDFGNQTKGGSNKYSFNIYFMICFLLFNLFFVV